MTDVFTNNSNASTAPDGDNWSFPTTPTPPSTDKFPQWSEQAPPTSGEDVEIDGAATLSGYTGFAEVGSIVFGGSANNPASLTVTSSGYLDDDGDVAANQGATGALTVTGRGVVDIYGSSGSDIFPIAYTVAGGGTLALFGGNSGGHIRLQGGGDLKIFGAMPADQIASLGGGAIDLVEVAFDPNYTLSTTENTLSLTENGKTYQLSVANAASESFVVTDAASVPVGGEQGGTDILFGERWNGTGGWTANPTDWSAGAAPTNGEAADIASGTATLDTGTVSVGIAIVESSAALALAGSASLAVGGVLTDLGTMTVDAAAGGGHVTAGREIDVGANATFSIGNGSLTANATVDTYNLENDGTITLEGDSAAGATASLALGWTAYNYGGITVLGGGRLTNVLPSPAVSGGTFVYDAAAARTGNFIDIAAGGGVLDLTGGSHKDFFELPVSALAARDTIAGGAGTDYLWFTTAGTVAASAWTHVSGIDDIRLASGTNNLTLSNAVVANADSKKIAINGFNGADTIDGRAVGAGNTVIFNGEHSAKTVYFAGAGPVILVGGAGDDVFEFSATNLSRTDTVNGGAGRDTLWFTTAGTVAASAFTNVSFIDTIHLANGTNNLTLPGGVVANSDADKVTINGGTGDDSVNASAVGASGTVLFNGGGGADTIAGGKGDNIYDFSNIAGSTLSINNAFAGGTAAHGQLDFGAGLTDEKLWFEQSGNNLVADVVGTKEKVTIENWFGANKSAQLTEIEAGGLKLDSQVQQLVQAMATYSTNNPGFDPTASGATMPNDPNLQSAIAASWHH